MDVLRATNLSSMLTAPETGELSSSCKGNSKSATLTNMKLDKDNVSKLVKTFSELSKHEKILFLINIREFTRDGGASAFCNGSLTPIPSIKQEQDDESGASTPTPTAASTPSTPSALSAVPSTPQAQRLSKTSNWLQKTFIQDSQVALPKEEVYSLYKSEFTRLGEKAISTADFGKLMRQVFPDVKARRLGQRGQSKYCYANIRKRSEIEKPALPAPLPQNELITWAKNKFNIDFSEVSQVVSYLKCDSSVNAGRKRRASCGGNLLKSGGGGGGGRGKNATRSASVSVLEIDNMFDNESLEIGSYFQDNNSTTATESNWPQLRSLLTDDSNSSFSGNFSTASSILGTTTTSTSSSSSKKKRHSSSVHAFEFIKPLQGSAFIRSQSVPVPVNSHQLDDELQSTSTSSIFDELSGTSGGEQNNPLFSSASVPTFKNNSAVSSSSSSTSSVIFDSIDISVGNGLGGSAIGVDINASAGVDVSGVTNGLLLNGTSHVGSDVFFDSVFDLMMSDCQN